MAELDEVSRENAVEEIISPHCALASRKICQNSFRTSSLWYTVYKGYKEGAN